MSVLYLVLQQGNKTCITYTKMCGSVGNSVLWLLVLVHGFTCKSYKICEEKKRNHWDFGKNNWEISALLKALWLRSTWHYEHHWNFKQVTENWILHVWTGTFYISYVFLHSLSFSFTDFTTKCSTLVTGYHRDPNIFFIVHKSKSEFFF